MNARPSLVICLMLAIVGWCLAGDVSGPEPPGSRATRAPILVAGKTSPSPQTSPGVVQNLAVDSLGSVLANITTSGLSSLLTTDLDSNGGANVTTGAGVALLVPAAGGPEVVPGDGTSGLVIQGARAHDATLTGRPVRIAGRARAINSPLTAVSGDDVCDLITTIDGLLRSVIDASGRTTGVDSYCTPAFAGGSSEVTIKASTGNVYDLHVANPNTTDVYLLLFDASNPTPGTTAPTRSFCVPGGTGSSNCGVYDLTLNPPIMFNTAITATVVTAANGSTAPSSAVDLNIGYK